MEKSNPPKKSKFNLADLKTRLLSAIVMVVAVGGAVYVGEPVFTPLVVLVMALCGYEWAGLCGLTKTAYRAVYGAMIGGALALSVYDSQTYFDFMVHIAPVLAVVLGAVAIACHVLLSQSYARKTCMVNALLAVFGVAYIGGGGYYLIVLRSLDMAWMVSLIAVLIAIDVGAYFMGRLLGGPKVWVAISPGKTWAGLLGACVACMGVMAFPYFPLFSKGLDYGAIRIFLDMDWDIVMALSVVLAVVAQAGDFLESWLKRRAGVKDSGAFIPGHGGFLDRLDGYFAVLIFVALFAFG